MTKHINIDRILEVLCPDEYLTNHPARLRKSAKQQLYDLISSKAIIMTERIESGDEYLDYKVIPIEAINDLFKGDKE